MPQSQNIPGRGVLYLHLCSGSVIPGVLPEPIEYENDDLLRHKIETMIYSLVAMGIVNSFEAVLPTFRIIRTG